MIKSKVLQAAIKKKGDWPQKAHCTLWLWSGSSGATTVQWAERTGREPAWPLTLSWNTWHPKHQHQAHTMIWA